MFAFYIKKNSVTYSVKWLLKPICFKFEILAILLILLEILWVTKLTSTEVAFRGVRKVVVPEDTQIKKKKKEVYKEPDLLNCSLYGKKADIYPLRLQIIVCPPLLDTKEIKK